MAAAVIHYFSVTKPDMVLGNLVSTAGGFWLAAKACVDPMELLLAVSMLTLCGYKGCRTTAVTFVIGMLTV